MTREEALNDWLPIIRQMVKGTEVYTEALDMAIEALEQEPCDDCVSRKAVLKIYDEWFATCNIADKKESPKRKMKALPPVAPQPKMGQWISYNWNDNGIARWGIKCDQCYKEYRYGGEMGGTYKYCPFCGCKMQEAKE